jgi:hypothetical protein
MNCEILTAKHNGTRSLEDWNWRCDMAEKKMCGSVRGGGRNNFPAHALCFENGGGCVHREQVGVSSTQGATLAQSQRIPLYARWRGEGLCFIEACVNNAWDGQELQASGAR